MRQHDSIIGRRISYNDNKYIDLTRNKEYIVIDERRSSKFKWSIEEILLKNDEGVKKWYPYNIYGILHFNLLSGNYIRYIGKNNELNNTKLYELFDRYSSEYYYFINDNGDYVGMIKTNFEEISTAELRNKKIDEIFQ